MINKSHTFDKDLIELADFAKAISHPARIAILKLLVENDLHCGEIVNALPLAQPTVSRHLNELKKAGLLSHEACGTRVCYRVNRDKLGLFCSAFRESIGRHGTH